jgi:peroxiredoxin
MSLLIALGAMSDAPLKPGDAAPDFKLPATNGETVTLAQYNGQKTVVLAFFPKAFTGG